MRRILAFGLLTALGTAGQQTLDLDEIRIRDPFVLINRGSRTYHMYERMGNPLNNPSKHQSNRGELERTNFFELETPATHSG